MNEEVVTDLSNALRKWRNDTKRIYLNTDSMRLKLPIEVSLMVTLADGLEKNSVGFDFDKNAWINDVLEKPFRVRQDNQGEENENRD